jgi:ribokinase
MSPLDTPTVIVVGSVNVDYLLRVERLPAPGETVFGGALTISPGGKGGNAAVAARMLGVRSVLVGAVGNDAAAGDAIAALAERDVTHDALLRVDVTTGAALVLVDGEGENQIAIAPGANAELDAATVRAAIVRYGGGGDAAVLANFEVPDAAVLAAAQTAAELGLPFVLDPAPARVVSPELAALCTVLTPNAGELDHLGYPSATGLLAAGARAVAVTLGARGCQLYHGGVDGPSLVAPFEARAVDSVGAGDAFAAGVAAGLAAGEPVEQAVRLGSAAGALTTEARGARAARYTRAQIDSMLNAAERSPTVSPGGASS